MPHAEQVKFLGGLDSHPVSAEASVASMCSAANNALRNESLSAFEEPQMPQQLLVKKSRAIPQIMINASFPVMWWISTT